MLKIGLNIKTVLCLYILATMLTIPSLVQSCIIFRVKTPKFLHNDSNSIPFLSLSKYSTKNIKREANNTKEDRPYTMPEYHS